MTRTSESRTDVLFLSQSRRLNDHWFTRMHRCWFQGFVLCRLDLSQCDALIDTVSLAESQVIGINVLHGYRFGTRCPSQVFS